MGARGGRAAAIVMAVGATLALSAGAPAAVTFQKSYALKPREGVFAYSRISPDGRYLAYASEPPNARIPPYMTPNRTGPVDQTQTVVDLSTGKVLFSEPGIDAYWSQDGRKIIYASYQANQVSLWDRETGQVSRGVAPLGLGDYFSWAMRDGQPMIMTIDSNYYALSGDKAVMPQKTVTACPTIGRGERPLVSKDGKRITTFVRGSIVVRDVADCDNIIDTGMEGAKADFSYDGRYIAFHDAKPDGSGSQIEVVDLEKRTVRTITADLKGSSLFPSWTRDGRLSFRYDGADYRGFMMADHVLSAPERPLPPPKRLAMDRRWSDIFPETPTPGQDYALVMIWGTWSAHSQQALRDLDAARADFARRGVQVAVLTAPEPSTYREDLDRIRGRAGVSLPEIPLTPAHFALTEGSNQIPSTLLFRNGALVDRRLGPQSYQALHDWIGAVTAKDDRS